MSNELDVLDEQVRALLQSADPRPSKVDIGRALEAGRRQARRRRSAMALAAAAVALALVVVPVAVGVLRADGAPSQPGATQPAGPPAATTATRAYASCQPSALALPAGVADATATGSDPTGRYISGASIDRAPEGETSLHAIVWDNGNPKVIPVSGALVDAVAVNSHGVVVGQGMRANATWSEFGWIYHHGVVDELPGPPGYPRVTPQAVNVRDDVVGFAFDVPGQRSVAVIWPAGDPTRVRILTAPNSRAGATGIADDGTVVGVLSGRDGAYLWDATGKGHLLTPPAGFVAGGAAGIRGEWAVGFANRPEAPKPTSTAPALPRSGEPLVAVGVRWNLRTGEATAYPQFGQLERVNARGDALTVDPVDRTDVVLADGQAVKLPGVGDLGHTSLVALNDTGTQVVGNSFTGTSDAPRRKPVVWHC
jgi:uncharacterized membrane protein